MKLIVLGVYVYIYIYKSSMKITRVKYTKVIKREGYSSG
jgi:hypothetical protein